MTNKFLLTLCLSVCIIIPFSNDIYLSGLPMLGKDLHQVHTDLVMSIFLLAAAIAQPIYWPLLDRFGRKPVLQIGLLLFTAASALVTFAPSYSLLIVGRFIQAFGACATLISTLTIARDIFPKDKLILATSIIMGIIGFCPAVAPFIGSFLVTHFGWRMPFAALLGMGVFYSLVITFALRETISEKNLNAIAPKQLFNNYLSLIKKPVLMRQCLTGALAYGTYFSYLAISAVILLKHYHLSPVVFGALIAINGAAVLLTSIITPLLTRRLGLQKVIALGLSLMFISAISMLIVNTIYPSIISIVAPAFLSTFGIGLIRPTASAGALQQAPRQLSGSAAALYNFCSFLGSAIGTTLVGHLCHSVSSYSLFILAFLSIGILISSLLRERPLKAQLQYI